jgi:hypothetical protein
MMTNKNIEYFREWHYEGLQGCGYSFPSDSDGNINMDVVSEVEGAGDNLARCTITGFEYIEVQNQNRRLIDDGIVRKVINQQ